MNERRYRVNFKTTGRGKVYPDVTVELSGEGITMKDVLVESARLLDNAKVIAKERSEDES